MDKSTIIRAIKQGHLLGIKREVPGIQGGMVMRWFISQAQVDEYGESRKKRRKYVRWTEDRDAALLELVGTCPMAQVAEYLDVGQDQVRRRLRRLKDLGLHDGIGRGANYSPYRVPSAGILIAKTCIDCGKLRSADHYSISCRKNRQPAYSSICKLCYRDRYRKPDSRPDRLRAYNENAELLNEITYATATRRRQPYEPDEDAVIEDLTISDFDAAIKLGRSYYAVRSQRQMRGLVKRTTDSYWVIHIPEAQVAVQEYFAALGRAVPEELWDWTDEEIAS